MLLLLALLFVAFSLAIPGFIQESTFSNVLNRSVTNGILAVGLTLCLVAGQIDLSMASALALAGLVFAILQPDYGIAVGAIAGVLSGTLVGVLNAFLVTVVRVQPFIATLGTLLLARGAAFIVSRGQPITGTALDAALAMNRFVFGPLSYRVLVLLVVAVLGHVFLTRMIPGRDLLAIGGNRNAAVAAGVPVEWRLALVFLLSGTCAGLAGVELGIALMAGSPIIGDTNFLMAAAAAFLGGTALAGGRGSVVATVLATLVLSTLTAGLELSFIGAAYQRILTGIVLLVAVTPFFAGGGFGRLIASAARRLRHDSAGGVT
jgi:ribose transport system permease protein